MRRGMAWLSVLLLATAGCAFHMPPPAPSVAYYAALIPPPVVQPVAPVVSAPPLDVPRLLHIVVSAKERTLTLYKGNMVLASYPVAIGFNGASGKRIQGDDTTPLGHYRIGWIRPSKRYGIFMGLTYPNRADAAWGLKEGFIDKAQYESIVAALDEGAIPPQDTPLGGSIGIHGMGPRFGDGPEHAVFPGRWTAGCVALSNWDVQQLAQMVSVGTPVEIVGAAPGFEKPPVTVAEAGGRGPSPSVKPLGEALASAFTVMSDPVAAARS